MRRALILSLVALALAGGGYLLGRHRGRASLPEPSVVRDTVTVRDTLEVEVLRYVERRTIDTLEVEVLATHTVHDTVYAQLPREEVTYRDSSYTAIVSGIRPRLDYLAIYPERQIVTVTERIEVPRTTRWGFGLQAGWGGVLAGGKFATGPYIGVGVSYNLAGW